MHPKGVYYGLVDRLEEADRGDRGWFVITRVHVALSWLKGIAEYLENRGGGHVINLTEQDYQRIARIVDIKRDNPGMQLRRHQLLVMDKPLQLLQRVNGQRWNQIVLTKLRHPDPLLISQCTYIGSVMSVFDLLIVPDR